LSLEVREEHFAVSQGFGMGLYSLTSIASSDLIGYASISPHPPGERAMNLASECWRDSFLVPEEEILANTVPHTTSDQVMERYDSNTFSHFERVIFHFECK
jgi:hypothetical protein